MAFLPGALLQSRGKCVIDTRRACLMALYIALRGEGWAGIPPAALVYDLSSLGRGDSVRGENMMPVYNGCLRIEDSLV